MSAPTKRPRPVLLTALLYALVGLTLVFIGVRGAADGDVGPAMRAVLGVVGALLTILAIITFLGVGPARKLCIALHSLLLLAIVVTFVLDLAGVIKPNEGVMYIASTGFQLACITTWLRPEVVAWFESRRGEQSSTTVPG